MAVAVPQRPRLHVPPRVAAGLCAPVAAVQAGGGAARGRAAARGTDRGGARQADRTRHARDARNVYGVEGAQASRARRGDRDRAGGEAQELPLGAQGGAHGSRSLRIRSDRVPGRRRRGRG
eukprot:Amastigsp_a841868_340.p5 type:complete len:121 gc:universal Amastigsp_a841868_340:612-974(+)